MVVETTKELALRGLTNAEVYQMDAEQLEFPAESFDYLLCGFAVWGIPLGDDPDQQCKDLCPGHFLKGDENQNNCDTLVRADTNQEVTLGELVSTGERDVPVWSLDHDWKMVPATLTHAFPSGTKSAFRMELASGRTVEATANHPFRTVTGWRRLDELAVGARIAVPRRFGAPERVGTATAADAGALAERAVADRAVPADQLVQGQGRHSEAEASAAQPRECAFAREAPHQHHRVCHGEEAARRRPCA